MRARGLNNALVQGHFLPGPVPENVPLFAMTICADEKQLKALREQCTEADAASECGILKELSGERSDKKAVRRSRHVGGRTESRPIGASGWRRFR